jgi:radical SAM superfamily enzyme YgiQ (UPF0313 family)
MRRDRRVAFVARDLVWEDKSGGVLPFSYAARKLDASIRTAPGLGDVATTLIDLRTDDVDAFFEQIREFRPTIVAASTYIWSAKLFGRLAEKVRRWDPSVRFVLGGPAARPSLLSLAPYAPYTRYFDAVVTGEGEEVIRHIADRHLEDDWTKTVPGLTVPHALGWRTTPAIEPPPLDDYASPYQLGTVPRGGIGYMETFRGCPMGCAFCQWGEQRSDRVHSAEYLATHLRGLRDAASERVYMLDAGFNLSARAFRNLAAAEREVGALRDLPVIGHIYPTYINDDHVEFFASLRQADLSIGIQSFDKDVLKRLGRPFDLSRFEHVLEELAGTCRLDLEIILGLPGDDPASFRRTFERATELGANIRVFQCLALPDALLERASEFDISFDPETFQILSCRGWTPEALRTEWEHVCAVTATMPRHYFGANWAEFRSPRAEAAAIRAATRPEAEDRPAVRSIAPEAMVRLREAIDKLAMGWRLAAVRAEGECLVLDLDGAAGPLVLTAEPAGTRPQHFAEHEGLAYSHRGQIARTDASRLGRFIQRVHPDVRDAVASAQRQGDAS